MTLPQIIVDLMKLLFDLAVPSAICTMVLAGIALRREGGLNFQIGRSFPEVDPLVGHFPHPAADYCPGWPRRVSHCPRKAAASGAPGS